MEAATVLRSARRRAGLTQAELARRARTSQATLSLYEAGHKVPNVATFSRLLAAAGARLVVGAAERPVVQPARADWARVAKELPEVLDLAEALPVRHERRLRFPRLGARAA